MSKTIVLPSVKGFFGDWVYYSSSVPLKFLVNTVLFAKDMYSESPKWSDMLQRELRVERGNEIAAYLSTRERFFNSLVIGVYAGSPQWIDINIERKDDLSDINDIPEETKNKVGFLYLSGGETLYALDGQHRLLGMKAALDNGIDIADDDVPVIFVSIGNTSAGHIRARRLFTTINKRAITVGLGAKIALDEDDIIAIVTRRLVDSGEIFNSNIILLRSTASLPAGEQIALTTAGNLYDVVKDIIVEYAKKRIGISKGILKVLTDSKHPKEEDIEDYYSYTKKIFNLLIDKTPYLHEYFTAEERGVVVRKYRGSHGGKIYFRPIGLQLFAKLFAECKGTPEERISFLSTYLPQNLNEFPYLHTIWDPYSNGIARGAGRLTRLHHLCRHMLGFNLNSRQEYSMKLALSYIQNTPHDDVEIPTPWVVME